MESTLEVVLGVSDDMKSENMKNFLKSRDSHSVELSKDDFEEVNGLQFYNSNIFEK